MKNYNLKLSLITIAIVALSQLAKAQPINASNSDNTKANLFSSLYDSEEKKDSTGIANAFENLGSYFAFINKKDSAIMFYGMAENMYKNVNDTAGTINASFNASMVYFAKGKNYIGINGLMSVLCLAELTKDSSRIADCYANLGKAYFAMKKYDNALEYMYKHLKLSQEINDNLKELDAYRNIATTYKKLNNTNKASKYSQLFEGLKEKLG